MCRSIERTACILVAIDFVVIPRSRSHVRNSASLTFPPPLPHATTPMYSPTAGAQPISRPVRAASGSPAPPRASARGQSRRPGGSLNRNPQLRNDWNVKKPQQGRRHARCWVLMRYLGERPSQLRRRKKPRREASFAEVSDIVESPVQRAQTRLIFRSVPVLFDEALCRLLPRQSWRASLGEAVFSVDPFSDV